VRALPMVQVGCWPIVTAALLAIVAPVKDENLAA
jgi:hypothetical protein